MIHAKTVSGGIYSFDLDKMLWTRSSDHDIIGAPGLNGSRLLAKPDIEVGERILILSTDGTYVSTSGVVEVWEDDNIHPTQSA